jgi:cytoskeletal protein CcmA (bactofilin family)
VPSIISADLTIRGDLTGKGDVQVEGKVIGRIEAGNLVVAEGGEVEGDIVAKAVAIAGTVRGSIKAGTVTLTSTARVQGGVTHDVLAIEAGAQLEGQCKRLPGAQTDRNAASTFDPEIEATALESDALEAAA